MEHSRIARWRFWSAVYGAVILNGCGIDQGHAISQGAGALVSASVSALIPADHTGVLIVTNALSCGLDGHDISRLNNLHRGGLPVEVVLLTPGRSNVALANEVASDMDLAMPHRALAMSGFSYVAGEHLRHFPIAVLMRSGQIKMIHAGNIDQFFDFIYSTFSSS